MACCSYSHLFALDEVPREYRVAYILDGYRSPGASIKRSLQYVFVLHNDVGNFWTHFVPVWVWLGWLAALSRTIDFTDPYWHPMMTLWFGGCGYALLSCIAHAFQCMSLKTSRLLFMMDYHAIVMYGLTECFAYTQYESPISQTKLTLSITLFYTCLSLTLSVLCCTTLFINSPYYRMCNTICSAVVHTTATIPLLNRLWLCATQGDQCIPETFNYHILNLIVPAFCAFFYVSKFPERCAPGYFNYVLQSHQLFHLSCVLHTPIQMYMMPIDALVQKIKVEEASQNIIPGLGNSLVCYMVAMILGLLFILLLHVISSGSPEQVSRAYNNSKIKLKHH